MIYGCEGTDREMKYEKNRLEAIEMCGCGEERRDRRKLYRLQNKIEKRDLVKIKKKGKTSREH